MKPGKSALVFSAKDDDPSRFLKQKFKKNSLLKHQEFA